MYRPDDELEKDLLRQGDIVSSVHILGALNLRAIQYQYVGLEASEPVGWSVPAKPTLGPAMVISHSCELDPANDVKITSIILAPLRDLSSATPAEKTAELIASNLIDSSHPTASYLKYFYLEPHAVLQFTAGCVADFSKCFSVRHQSYQQLLNGKVLQLRDDIADSMALKLALYFCRERD